jgi:hypothetical protein
MYIRMKQIILSIFVASIGLVRSFHPQRSSNVFSISLQYQKPNYINKAYLFATNDDELQASNRPGMKGLYRRPSKAIELGGGFFVPGLEGEKIRIVSSVLILLAIAANHFASAESGNGAIIGETVGILTSLLLLAQGLSSIFVFESNQSNKVAPFFAVLNSISEEKEPSIVFIDSLSRAIVRSVSSLSDIIVIQPSSNGDMRILYDFGYADSNRKISNEMLTDSQKKTISTGDHSQELYTIDMINKEWETFFPAARSLYYLQDERHLIWLLAFSREENLGEEDRKWIQSLLKCPFKISTVPQ